MELALKRQFVEVDGWFKDEPYVLPVDPKTMHWSMARCKGCYYGECDNTYHLVGLSIAQVVRGIATAVEPVFFELKNYPASVKVLSSALAPLQSVPWEYAAGVLSSEDGNNELLDRHCSAIDPLVDTITDLIVKLVTDYDSIGFNDLERLHKGLMAASRLSREFCMVEEEKLNSIEWFKHYDNWRNVWHDLAFEGGWSWPPEGEEDGIVV